jgi:hypothetical protein
MIVAGELLHESRPSFLAEVPIMKTRLLVLAVFALLLSQGAGQSSQKFTDAQLEMYLRSVCGDQLTIGEGMTESNKLYLCGVCPDFTPAPGWTNPNGGSAWEYADRLEGRFSQTQRPEVILTFQGCEQIDPGGGAILLQFDGKAWQRLDYFSGPPFEPGYSSLHALRQKNGLDLMIGLNNFTRNGQQSVYLTASQYNRNLEGLLGTQLLFNAQHPDGSACKGAGSSLMDSPVVKLASGGKLRVAFSRSVVNYDAKCQVKIGPAKTQMLEWTLNGSKLVPSAATVTAMKQLKIAP